MSARTKAHVMRTQHWTYCGRRPRPSTRIIPRRKLREEVTAARGRPDEVCRYCYSRWKEDPYR